MESLLLCSEMEPSYPAAWSEKILPSPTSSEDSGLGWAPSPTDSDRRFQMESPGKRYVVPKCYAEEASPPAYNYDDHKSFLSQLGPPVIKSNSKLDNQSPNLQKSFAPEIERYIVDLLDPLPNYLSPKSCSKPNNKKRNSTNDSSVSIKLERCLQPKTGNGKPRQTSTKRKMSQKPKPKSAPYPGVRVPTVRQRLDQLKKEKRERESAEAKHASPHFSPPLPSSASYSPSSVYSYTDMQQGTPLYHGEPATPRHNFTPVETQPANILSENLSVPDDLVDAPVTAFQQISPTSSPLSTCGQQLANPCGHVINVSSPPNVTLINSMQQQLVPTPTCMVEQPNSNAFFDSQQSNAYSTSQPYISSPTYYNTNQSEPSPVMKTAQSPSYSFSPAQQFSGSYTNAINQPMYQISSPMQQRCGDDQTQTYTSLHDIAAVGNVQLLSAYLSKNPGLAEMEDNSGLLPIFHAIKNDQIDAVRLLLNHSPRTCSAPDGTTVLHEAARLPSPDMLALILSVLKDLEIHEIVNRKSLSIGGLTPLHLATQAGRTESMALLLRHGANILAKADDTCSSSLHFAIKNVDQNAVQVLVEFARNDTCQVGFDVALSNQDRKMPIKRETLATLVCQPDSNGNTPLHFAAELQAMYRSHVPVVRLFQLQSFLVRYLLENGADKTAMNVDYKMPFELLPPDDGTMQSHELRSLFLNFSPKTAGISVKLSPSFREASISAFNFNSSPLHQGGCDQLPGSKGPFLQ